MPLYYFVLKDGRQIIPDRDGEEFADRGAARDHAVAVARELMRNGSLHVHNWRLQVCDEYLWPCYELLFPSIDDSLSHRSSFKGRSNMPAEIRPCCMIPLLMSKDHCCRSRRR